VLARPDRQVAADLVGIFGWSLPFEPEIVGPQLLSLMRNGGILVERGNLLASTVRVSSLGDLLFLHSAYPTIEGDAVFFGPDTYRFARFIEAELADALASMRRLVDIGCGSGAGAIVAARAAGATDIVMTDINPAALRLARINAAAAGIDASTASSDILRDIDGTFDLVVANPPYLVDDDRRVYRHGGDALGADLSLRIACEAADRLNPSGRLLLYTASAIVDGVDGFRAAVVPMLQERDCATSYEEIDPDVFGEELERPAYRTVDRIAVVGVTAIKRVLQ
jgi:SAM-dependent methyltransferase